MEIIIISLWTSSSELVEYLLITTNEGENQNTH